MSKHWISRSIAAGLCGTVAHSLLMLFKSWMGLLPSFQPYESLQSTLTHLIGRDVHPATLWLLSFLNGAMIVGFFFGRTYRYLPGKGGAVKGAVFGLIGWLLMGLLFFPWLGLGFFGAGVAPAVFSLAMIQAYSVIMGIVYEALDV